MKINELVEVSSTNNTFLKLLGLSRKYLSDLNQANLESLDEIRNNLYKSNIGLMKIAAKVDLDTFENKLENLLSLSNGNMLDLTDTGLQKYFQTARSWLNEIRRIRRKLQV